MKPNAHDLDALRKLARSNASAYAALVDLFLRFEQAERDGMVREDDPQALLRRQGSARAARQVVVWLSSPYLPHPSDEASATSDTPRTLI